METIDESGMTASGKSVLEDDWFTGQATEAFEKYNALKITGNMELRFGLLGRVRKSQIELLSAVRNSTVSTFGWPIPILLENREEYKPKPLKDGIRAEVAIDKQSDRFSFDFWAASNSGQFYMLQSLFEDSRRKKEIFFNTRIVRVTESLMFAFKFFDNLGVARDSMVALRIGHGGLKGRTLTSSGNRMLSLTKVSHEEHLQTEIILTLAELNDQLSENVRKLLSPFFLLFDFQEFGQAIYDDIVKKFEAGQVT
jgi:hypothetical protein